MDENDSQFIFKLPTALKNGMIIVIKGVMSIQEM